MSDCERSIVQRYSTIALCCCCVIILIGIGISEIKIYISGNKYPQGTCGKFPPNLTSFTAEKAKESQWTLTYKFKEFEGEIVHICPSLYSGVKVKVNHDWVVRSDGKFLMKDIGTAGVTSYIHDCNGHRLFTMVIKSNINNTWHVRCELISINNTVLAFANIDPRIFTNSIDVIGMDGQIVANMKRDALSIPWKWKFTIYIPNHPGSDPRVLTIIAGRTAFSQGSNEKDLCNRYFSNVAIIFMIIAVLIACYGCIRAYFYYSKRNVENKSEFIRMTEPK